MISTEHLEKANFEMNLGFSLICILPFFSPSMRRREKSVQKEHLRNMKRQPHELMTKD